MRRSPIAAAAVALACCIPLAQAAPAKVPAAHPILGKWSWTRSGTGCPESFEYRSDSTVHVVSGDEITDSTFLIDRVADERRFYQIKLKTVKDNGGTDCNNDEKDNTGEENTVYIFINSERSMQVVCTAATFESCFGPLQRATK